MANFENAGRQKATINASGAGTIQGSLNTITNDDGTSFSQSNAPRSTDSSKGGNRMQGQVASGQQASYQYINKQVNNVNLVNKNSLTLNVRNYNNRINNININHIQEIPGDPQQHITTQNITINPMQTTIINAKQGISPGPNGQSNPKFRVMGNSSSKQQLSGNKDQHGYNQVSTSNNNSKSNRQSRDNSFQKGNESQQMVVSGGIMGRPNNQQQQLQQYIGQNQINFKHQVPAKSAYSPSQKIAAPRGSTKMSAQASSDIHSTQSSRPNINYKNIQGGIAHANGSNYTGKANNAKQPQISVSKSQQNLTRATVQNMGATVGHSGSNTGKYVNNNGMRGSASSSLLGINAQNKRQSGFNNNMGGTAAQQPRQSSQGPSHSTSANVVQSVPTNYSHLKTTSRDFQNTGQLPTKNIVSRQDSGKAANASMLSGTQNAIKFANSSNAYANQSQQQTSQQAVNVSQNRSNSRTSGYSASNISNNGSSNGQNMVNAKLQDQQTILNKFIDKEKKYNEKIKRLKAENNKLIKLLKDSEKLYFQKLNETKQQSASLSMLIKQLWPVIKMKVKDPTLLMNTINQCMQQMPNGGKDLSIAPLIEDIELLSKEEQKANLKNKQSSEPSNDLSTGNDSANVQNALRQAQTDIENLRVAYQEQVIQLDNSFNIAINQRNQELKQMQKTVSLQSQVIPGMSEVQSVPSSIMKALDFTLDIEENELYPPEDLRSSVNPSMNPKLRALSGQRSALDNIRMSNPSQMYGDQQSKLLIMQHKGRNYLRQSNELSGSKGISHQGQQMSHSKSASSLQKSITTSSSKIGQQANKGVMSKTQLVNNYIDGSDSKVSEQMRYPDRLNLSNKRSNQSKMAYGGSALSHKDQQSGVRSKSSQNSGADNIRGTHVNNIVQNNEQYQQQQQQYIVGSHAHNPSIESHGGTNILNQSISTKNTFSFGFR